MGIGRMCRRFLSCKRGACVPLSSAWGYAYNGSFIVVVGFLLSSLSL
jgi:hypothetical protein